MPDSYSRRNFLKLSAALLAGGAAIANPDKALAIGYVSPKGGAITEGKGYSPFSHVLCTYTARGQD